MVLHPQAEAESTRQSSRAEQATARAQRLDEEVQRLHATQQEAQEQLAGRVAEEKRQVEDEKGELQAEALGETRTLTSTARTLA